MWWDVPYAMLLLPTSKACTQLPGESGAGSRLLVELGSFCAVGAEDDLDSALGGSLDDCCLVLPAICQYGRSSTDRMEHLWEGGRSIHCAGLPRIGAAADQEEKHGVRVVG